MLEEELLVKREINLWAGERFQDEWREVSRGNGRGVCLPCRSEFFSTHPHIFADDSADGSRIDHFSLSISRCLTLCGNLNWAEILGTLNNERSRPESAPPSYTFFPASKASREGMRGGAAPFLGCEEAPSRCSLTASAA